MEQLATLITTPPWLQEAGGFVCKRKKITGGFSATPRLPPTIQDTYYSLNILTLLAKHGLAPCSSNDGLLRDYLSRSRPEEKHSAKVTFQRLASFRLAGGEASADSIMAFVHRRRTETDDLEERYYCSRLMQEIIGRDDLESPWIADQQNLGSFRTASELWMLLTLAHGRSPADLDVVSWLQKCQTYDGGFGFFPGTTSFLENGYDCLRALHHLGSRPRYPEDCRAFILACCNKTGGFTRKGGATAFLSSTWQALASLELLAGMDQRCKIPRNSNYE
jgi:hypothetical protein